MKKLLKMIGLTITGFILLILLVGAIFINTSPQFGGKHTKEDVKRYQESGHYKDGKFINLTTTVLDMSFKNIMAMLKEQIKGNPNKKPSFKLPQQAVDSLELEKKQICKQINLVWTFFFFITIRQ